MNEPVIILYTLHLFSSENSGSTHAAKHTYMNA
jgi:hypothetical protein